MAGVIVEWNGLTEWIAHTQDIKKLVPEKADDIMEDIGKDAKEVMDSHTPVGKKSTKHHEAGTLKRNNTLTPIGGGFQLSNAAETEKGVIYSPFLEYGTRKMRAQPFLEPTTEYARGEMESRLPSALEV